MAAEAFVFIRSTTAPSGTLLAESPVMVTATDEAT
jgi:hypothetical protein